MAQDKQTDENNGKKPRFDFRSAVQSVTNIFHAAPRSNAPEQPRHTVAAPSQAPSHAHETVRQAAPEESRVGDVLDTAGMPKPKPSSVNFHAFDGLYGEKSENQAQDHYESEAEREFDRGYVGSANVTIRGLMREYTKKLWVRMALGAFGLLLAVFLAYQFYLRVYTGVKTETATITYYSETIDVEGVAIRDETLIGGSVSGAAVSAVKNGEKVLKGEPVINLFSSAKAAEAYERIAEIDRQIAELESMVTASEDSANAVHNIDNLLDEQMMLLSDLGGRGDMSQLDDIKGEVSYLLNKQLVAMRKVENYQDKIDALTSEKERLSAANAQAPATVNAPTSGYYIDSPDGYESLLTPSMLDTLTPAGLKQIMSRKVSVPENSAGKLMKDFTWYLACPVPAQDAKDVLAVKSVYTLLLPYSETGSLQATLMALNPDENGKTVLAIFKCTTLGSELCDLRTQPVKIQIRSFKGFNIKKDALHVRIRQKEDTDEEGNTYSYEERLPCVYIQVGHQIYPRLVDILYNNDKFVICAVNDNGDSEYLSVYDEVITEGRGLYERKIVE